MKTEDFVEITTDELSVGDMYRLRTSVKVVPGIARLTCEFDDETGKLKIARLFKGECTSEYTETNVNAAKRAFIGFYHDKPNIAAAQMITIAAGSKSDRLYKMGKEPFILVNNVECLSVRYRSDGESYEVEVTPCEVS